MKIVTFNLVNKIVFCSVLVFVAACAPTAQKVNEGAGFNGGFEVWENGLPVNWIIYQPENKETRCRVVGDSTVRTEGKFSLRFDVSQTNGAPGRFSPGFTNEVDADTGECYEVSFKVKRNRAHWRLQLSAVDAHKGIAGPLATDEESDTGWTYQTVRMVMPPDMKRLRMELNIVSPGQVWIDDLKCLRVN